MTGETGNSEFGRPLTLIVSGEARRHVNIIQQLLGPALVSMANAASTGELLATVKSGDVDAVVIDSDDDQEDLLTTLRIIRRIDTKLPVVLVASQSSRHFLEGALRLAAFSVVSKPIEREELIVQLHRIVEKSGKGKAAEKNPAQEAASEAEIERE